MKALINVLRIAVVVGFGVVLWLFASARLASRSGGEEVHSALGREILVMRTPGGLLEVATIRATEQFDTTFTYKVLGLKVGETVPHIRVPATYRYHVELAPEWRVRRREAVFSVIAPPVRPSLPVAVDLGQMQKDVGGSWVLVPFNASDDLDALQRRITAELAAKAASPAYLQLQREQARRTVTEFVRKWLVTQQEWQSARDPQVEVRFADEAADRAAR
ncbi:MAG: hypothetical protein U1F11_01570 [Steroidobacteraceae bacterium]